MRTYAVTRRTAEGPGLTGRGSIQVGTVLETVEADGLDLAGKGAVAFWIIEGATDEPLGPGSRIPRRRITRVLGPDAFVSVVEVES